MPDSTASEMFLPMLLIKAVNESKTGPTAESTQFWINDLISPKTPVKSSSSSVGVSVVSSVESALSSSSSFPASAGASNIQLGGSKYSAVSEYNTESYLS
jgi:hypothetical protein